MDGHIAPAFDAAKLEAFMGRVIGDLAGAFSIGPVQIGSELGLYAAMAEAGPVTPDELAAATGCAVRYVIEWLGHQVASGYVEYDKAGGRFILPPEHAFALADPHSPAHIVPGFATAAALAENKAVVAQAFRTGGGVPFTSQSGCLACSIAEFFRPGYRAHLIGTWLPALDGVVETLEAGAKVVDVGCGHGHTTRIMAETFPNSTFIGIDIDRASIAEARAHAGRHGGIANLSYEVATAQAFEGSDFDFAACFDALHDMGDPVGAARRIHAALKPGGRWMIVEPFAHDGLENNMTPINRMSYAASTMTCVPSALSQDGGYALGAQAGQARLREVIVDQGGFARLRRAAETPLNLILEASKS